MNKKYLIGFELYLMEDSYFEEDKKISFESLKEIRKFLIKYYNVRHVKFIERSEATFSLTIEPIEVKLTSTGNDNAFKKITKNFDDIYSKICVKSGCKQFLNFLSPIYFTIKNKRLTIYRECFEDLDVNLNDVGMKNYYEIFKEDIKRCREHYKRYVVSKLNKVGFDSEQEESFYEMIEFALSMNLENSLLSNQILCEDLFQF